jgi:phage terminase small subunit
MAKKQEFSIKAPEPPETLTEIGRDCWRSLASAIPDWREADLHLLLTACHWHESFTQAVADARESKDPGEKWKHETKMSMCSKQYLACLRALGILQKRRVKPNPM